MASVLVIMATYNGEEHVEEQIESILEQSDVDVSLYISDDCSTDHTLEICKRYAQANDNIVVSRNDCNKRVAKNFMDALYGADLSSYDYIAFSDQDDVWLPDKLIQAIAAIERSGSGPRLYYSDVLNVDSHLGNPKTEYFPFIPYAKSLKLLLTINWALGCTMVFNRAFADEISSYIPPSWPRIHDVWVHLVALAHGWTVPDLDHSYILRRITGDNQVGMRKFGSLGIRRFLVALRALFSSRDRFSTTAVKYLLEGYWQSLPEESLCVLESFLKLNGSFFGRVRLAFDRDFAGPYSLENTLYRIKMLLGMY